MLVRIDPVQKTERGVQTVQPPTPDQVRKLHWDDLRLMALFEDHKSMRQAAGSFGVSVNTVRSRIDRVERILGHPMFFRGSTGLRLTAEGQVTVRLAQNMRLVAGSVVYAEPEDENQPSSDVNICCSEGLASFWLLPRLGQLRDMLPRCHINFRSEKDQTRIHDRRNDISVGFSRPKDLSCVTAKLATVHMMLFCSDSYIARHGLPLTIDDLDRHYYLEQRGAGLNPDLAVAIGGQALFERSTALTVDSSFALFSAVADGLGIGALPTYAGAVSRHVRPLDLPVRLRFDVWMSYDAGVRDRIVTRCCIDWLKQSFDQAIYPWFGDKFLHPNAFESGFHDSHTQTFFDGMIDR